MVSNVDVRQMSLIGLSHQCERQTARFWQRQSHDTRYCHELLRRALSAPDSAEAKQAWNLVHRQYHRQTTLWVKRHRAFPATGREPETLADMALAKMWVAFANDPAKFAQFPDESEAGVKALLRFLQLCVHSVVMDALSPLDAELPGSDDALHDTATTTEDPDTLAAADFWRCIHDRLKTAQERVVIDASYVYGLKPSQIYELHDDLFENVREIHRTKENVLARLRRDDQLRACFE